MDDIRLGVRVRIVRDRLGWRQKDVAVKADVSPATVARIEHGQLDHLQIGVIRAVLKALEIELALEPRWRGGDLDRLADEGHAVLVGRTAGLLEAAGWVVQAEVSFSVYGERGSMDLLAWHAPTRTLLVVEIKTSLNSIEETLRRQDMKVRLAAGVARERFGWQARSTAWLLALPEDVTARRRVGRHASLLDRAYPTRGHEARAWIRAPHGATGMLVFLGGSEPGGNGTRLAPRRRVRRPQSLDEPATTERAPRNPKTEPATTERARDPPRSRLP